MDVMISQFSVSKTIHVLDVERQLVVGHLIPVLLISALHLESKKLEVEKVTEWSWLQR